MALQGLTDMEKAILLERQCPAVEARTHGESLSTRGCALGSLNTVNLVSRSRIKSCYSEKNIELGRCQCLGSFQERSLRKRIKGMSGTPKSD